MHITFSEAMALAADIGIAEEKDNYKDSIILVLKDGRRLKFTSQYEEDWSSVTPGRGITPPIVTLEE